ncbi:hypothetical protein U9M48_008394 [Paspalum notatum var. saurae]|uniref:Uncharacterized protein n=1 Tax=Paspalum notatum var. saurae TaxID=547442 RepID=A0AAQ3WDD6_PASNO
MKNAFKKAKKAVSKAGQHIRWSSSEGGFGSASQHAASERMSISTEEPEKFQTSSTHRPILILDSQLVPCTQEEAKALRLLNQKSYALTKCFDEDLLVDTGMREEFKELEPEPEPGRNSISGVMACNDAEPRSKSARPTRMHSSQEPNLHGLIQAHPLGKPTHRVPGTARGTPLCPPSTRHRHIIAEVSPSHSARYTGGELDGNFTALFEALDLQEHRTLGMIDNIADIQQQQGVDHNLILEKRATVDCMQEQNLMYYNWKGF